MNSVWTEYVQCAPHHASPDGWAVWGVVVFTRWWFLVDHCVLWNWDRILVRAVKGLISRAGMVSICPLLWQRDDKLQQTKLCTPSQKFLVHCLEILRCLPYHLLHNKYKYVMFTLRLVVSVLNIPTMQHQMLDAMVYSCSEECHECEKSG